MSFLPPNAAETEAVAQLKERLHNEIPKSDGRFTDTTILRFYRGRKLDEEKAFKGLIHYLQWRKDNDVDNIQGRIAEFQREYDANKIVPSGIDKEGHPSLYVYAGRHNKNDRDMEQLRLLIIYALETVLKQTNPETERLVICFDLKDFSMKCMDYDAVKMLMNILSYNYPDTLHIAFVINAPFIFSACWAMICPWLDPVTAAKVKFIKTKELSGYFDPENIPADA